MTLENQRVEQKTLSGNPKALRLSERFPGKMLTASFVSLDGKIKVTSQIILRDGSHYLRQKLTITATEDMAMQGIVALQCKLFGKAKVLGNTRGSPIVSDGIFAGLETPMGINSIIGSSIFSPNSWKDDSWSDPDTDKNIPKDIHQKYMGNIVEAQGNVQMPEGKCTFTFNYKKGNNRLNILGVQVLSGDRVVSEDWHEGFSGCAKNANTYTVQIPTAGNFTIKYFAQNKTEPVTSEGEIISSQVITKVEEKNNNAYSPIRGFWSRKTTLKAKETWRVSSVIGLLEPGQECRSFLAYSERERPVSWRPFIHYNSWYELNINRNDFKDPLKRMSEKQCLDVVSEWKEKLYDKHGTYIDAFVWDDGWDEFNSFWRFHIGFPEGFKNIDRLARFQKAGIGAWLGPVGGYGGSKAARLANWNRHHSNNQIGNFQLSNQEYFNALTIAPLNSH